MGVAVGVHEGPIWPMDKCGHNFQPYWLIWIKLRHIIFNRISVCYYLTLAAYSLQVVCKITSGSQQKGST